MTQNINPQKNQWRSKLSEGRSKLITDYKNQRNSKIFLFNHTKLIDSLIKQIWQKSTIANSACLVAVGGYGRNELFPYSDVDILVLLPERQIEGLNAVIEKFIGMLWDVGLEVGHSVRDIASCLKLSSQDISIATNLLDQRYITGDNILQENLANKFYQQLDSLNFIEGKLLEKQQRHTRYFGIANNLEPNIKESPGGLRDLDTMLWISKVIGLGNTPKQLAKNGFLSKSEQRQLEYNRNQLKTLRIDIHLAAKRHEERLVFDFQNSLAKTRGFYDLDDKLASEQLMQLYFKTARSILQFSEILLPNMLASFYSPFPHNLKQVNEKFYSVNGLLEITDNQLFEKNTYCIFEAFSLFQTNQYLIGFAPQLLQSLWRARTKINASFRKDEKNRQLFIKIFNQPRLSMTLRQMNLYGVLGKYLPAFGRIIGRMQHDLFHVYTVDEHILMVVRNLCQLSTEDLTYEHPFLSHLMHNFPKPELIYIAALFHDIAKGSGNNHAQAGMPIAKKFCHDHALSEEDSALVVWLVGQHLEMSLTTQKQDIYDPQVAQNFAELVGNELRLNALYILTFADIRATNPKVWNAWKASLLESLYKSSLKALQNSGQYVLSALEERKKQTLEILSADNIKRESIEELWSKLDNSYFLRHNAKEITWHVQELNKHIFSEHPIVRSKFTKHKSAIQLLIYTPDQNKLFARLCTFFSLMNYNIADAKIYTTLHNYALDTFVIFIPEHIPNMDNSNHNDGQNLLMLIEQQLLSYLAKGYLQKPALGLSSRRLRYSSIQPKVSICLDENKDYYLLSLIAGDRQGMLARVVQLLAHNKISVHHAKITTFGERAEDSLLIKGAFLNTQKQRLELEQQIIKLLSI